MCDRLLNCVFLLGQLLIERGEAAVIEGEVLSSEPSLRQGRLQPAPGFTFAPSMRLLLYLRHTLPRVMREVYAIRYPNRTVREGAFEQFSDAFVARVGRKVSSKHS